MRVIFFDGYCGLCNGFVDFMMKVDSKGVFNFSPLQGEFAKSHLSQSDILDLKSVVILIDGKTYRKAKGVFKALGELGGFWKAFLILNIIPTPILNSFYDMVATNRYRLFGKRATCRLPTQEERNRFIL
jgi:predicted DCC family thiol-disulfide oxidoreductase YuxK